MGRVIGKDKGTGPHRAVELGHIQDNPQPRKGEPVYKTDHPRSAETEGKHYGTPHRAVELGHIQENPKPRKNGPVYNTEPPAYI